MKISRRFAPLVGFLVSLGCVHPASNSGRREDRETVDQALSGELSLKADREQLSEMRKEIPKEKQKSNDELALYLNLMKQGTEQPQMVRDKFTMLAEKRRASFREKVQRLRDNYRRDESKRRDEYLDSQKAKRSDYLKSKHKSEELREFFSSQDKERQSFFSDERDRRSNFESEVSSHSKDFDSYMREKMNEFNEQYRLYSKKFSEKPKDKKAVTGETDFKRIDDVPAKALGTED